MAIITGTNKSETLDGTPEADTISGLGGNDTLNGRASADILDGGTGNDAMFGGGGWDIYYVDSMGDTVNERFREGRDEVRTALGAYTLSPNVEILTYTGAGNFAGTGNELDNTIKGGNGNDTLTGGFGNDKLCGFDGNDILDGGSGIDIMVGGRGSDVYQVGDVGDRVFEANRGGTDEVRTTLTSYTLDANVENLTYTAFKQFSGTGNALRNIIKGGEFDDTLTGGGNNDRLFGGDGNDTAVFAGKRADYTITTIGLVTTVVDNNALDGNDGKDTLDSIEQLKFADEVVIIGNPAAKELADLDGSNGFRVDGVSEVDQSGTWVSSAGDVNNDGFEDFIIGARAADPDGLDAAGASYVVFGKAGGWSPSLNLSTIDGTNGFRLDGTQVEGTSGSTVVGGGDLNGDGFDDVVVGAPGVNVDGNKYAGASYVVFGKASGWSASIDLSSLNGTNGFRLDGANENDFSTAISLSGDVNGDGLDDLTIASSTGTYVVFGKTGGWTADVDLSSLDGKTGFRVIGSEFSIGGAVSAGDVNGDGFDDLIAGSYYAYVDGNKAAGASYVLFGKASGWTSDVDVAALDGKTGFRLDGGSPYEGAGRSVASAGDINGDGFADFLVGAGIQPYSLDFAVVSYVVFGKASGWSPTQDLADLDGTDGFRIARGRYEESIFSVSTAGDVNGDGLDDILIGAPFQNPDLMPNTGASYVIYGKTSGWDPTFELSSVDATNGFRLDGQEGDQIGRTVSAAGDVNGDGFSDLIVGAEAADHTATDAGSSYVIFGGNFTGAVTHLGTAGNDTLTGSAAAESFVGGLGNDILNSGGGVDAFQGGAGNDTIGLVSASFFHIDGGSGADIIALNGAGLTLDLTTIPPARIESIERINITGTGNNAVRVSIADVLDISDDSNSLRVAGNAGDSADIGAGWTKAATGGSNGNGTSTIDGQTYQHYNAGQASLLVDTDVGVLVS